jgi:hypothetical protein
MILGCITLYNVGKLVRIDGKIDAKKYTDVLESGLFSTIKNMK